MSYWLIEWIGPDGEKHPLGRADSETQARERMGEYARAQAMAVRKRNPDGDVRIQVFPGADGTRKFPSEIRILELVSGKEVSAVRIKATLLRD